MQIDNGYISDQFTLLAKLMDIHGENSFKSKSYANTAFTVDKLPMPLHGLSPDKIFAIKGIGESSGKKILEILETGTLSNLTDLISNTPSGVLEMLQIKGLGPKKIATVWKEMGIESLGELLYACNENRLLLYKGFGEKTQKNVKDAIEFFMRNKGSFLWAEIEPYALQLEKNFQTAFAYALSKIAGNFVKQMDTIDELTIVTTAIPNDVQHYLITAGFSVEESTNITLIALSPEQIKVEVIFTAIETFGQTLLSHSSDAVFVEAIQNKMGDSFNKAYVDDKALLEAAGLPAILPALRRSAALDHIIEQQTTLIQPNQIKGIVHSHSNWSDGVNTIEEMVKACIQQGYEYLVISDHSKSAFYANGLNEERIKEQHLYINQLNQQYANFKIFKSIECDILNDGQLDYSNEILSTFDLIIASVHSNLKMTEEKAMQRLLTAIQNPYTTILGHMTGRLLLSRPGYPVDHKTIIDACADHSVAIEINAHPRRLDIDWTWIQYAMQKGVPLSIDPDAHSIEGFHDCRFGVIAAQKAGLSAAQNLSSLTLNEFEAYLQKVKQRRF
jgi:DNA polymerase (family 10)